MFTLALLSLGGLLQVLGVGFTAWGVHKVRDHFGMSQPSRLRRWVTKSTQQVLRAKRNLFRQPTPRVKIAESSAVIATSEMKGKARITFAPLDRAAPIENQIGLLDGWLRSILDIQFTHLDASSAADQQLHSEIEVAKQEQRNDLQSVDQSFKDLATGGLRLQSWSVYLIILGTILLTTGSALAV